MPETETAADKTNTEAAGETKSEETQTEETKSEAKETLLSDKDKSQEEETKSTEEQKPVVPEKYEDFTIPEGMELDAELLTDFQNTAKELGLTQDAAQKLVDFGAELLSAGYQAQRENLNTTMEGWEAEIKADEEYGGDKLNETLDRGKRVIRDHGSKELLTVLEETGMGSNPHLIRFLAKLDKALGEDKTVDGKPAVTDKDAASVLYDGK
jgi:hypothetical protein